MAKKFRDFKSAREFVRKIGVKSAKEWRTYCKSGNKPEDIPSAPNQIYKNKGWISWGDFWELEIHQVTKSNFGILNHLGSLQGV